MSKLKNIKVQTYVSDPPVFNRNGIMCLFYLEVKSKDNGVICMQEYFWDELEKESKEDQEIIKKQLIEYLLDQHNYDEDSNHPLKNDFEAYKAYCELRYNKLDKFHNRLLAQAMAPVIERMLAANGEITRILNEQNIDDSVKEQMIKALKDNLGNPKKFLELLDNM